ncbi:CoA transferase subunit A [Syntrophobacter fumaroxidans]|uniref:Coenzyme A transferase n=1 Tax=Syntrophobacter fumaroxidans (strain DSM 10017 / MPOB) TaxID=335543 RepID=A0LGF7_SYNFM|nr:CoA-transferase [Syntrophobacter fumaroxidans]ABK16509.1 coenzyme A transferase [Syntrophobacter fumaroxidans MPOB]
MAAVRDKRMTLKEAVSKYVNDGDTVYYGGFQIHVPMALTHEIIRQKKKNLHIINASTDVGGLDLLVAGGCVSEMHIAWAMNWYVKAPYAIRRAFQSGQLKRFDLSNFGATSALIAGFLGIPFIPVRGNIGTDIIKYNQTDAKVIEDPFTGSKITVVRGWRADVAIIHAQKVDRLGNVVTWGTRGVTDEFGTMGTKRGVIVTAEEIVEPEEVRSDPDRTLVPYFKTLAVVHCPWGAHPSACRGYYGLDIRFSQYQGKYERSAELLPHFMKEWIFGCEDHAAYIKKYVSKFGQQGLDRLKPVLGFEPKMKVDYGYHDPAVWKGVPQYTDEHIKA